MIERIVVHIFVLFFNTTFHQVSFEETRLITILRTKVFGKCVVEISDALIHDPLNYLCLRPNVVEINFDLF